MPHFTLVVDYKVHLLEPQQRRSTPTVKTVHAHGVECSRQSPQIFGKTTRTYLPFYRNNKSHPHLKSAAPKCRWHRFSVFGCVCDMYSVHCTLCIRCVCICINANFVMVPAPCPGSAITYDCDYSDLSEIVIIAWFRYRAKIDLQTSINAPYRHTENFHLLMDYFFIFPQTR